MVRVSVRPDESASEAGTGNETETETEIEIEGREEPS
jgi:hypothetical protein